MAANNDCSIRIFDTEYFDLLKHYVFPWSVNVSRPLTVLCTVVLSLIWLLSFLLQQSVSVSPNGKLFAVLGDHEDGCVVDPKCGKVSEWIVFPSISFPGHGAISVCG